MTKLNGQIEDALSLVEHNYQFLHVGRFFDEYAKKNDLTSEVKNLQLQFDDGKTYTLVGNMTSESLRAYLNNQNKPTIFGYLVEWNAFRGIGMAMKEGLKNNSLLNNFVKEKLGDRYECYHPILCFIRNVLSHNIHNEIHLKEEDYRDTRRFFMKTNSSGNAKFTIKYIDDFPELKPPHDYGFTMEVNFNSLRPGNSFIDVISGWHLYMFSELCFNLVASFRKHHRTETNA